MNKSSPPQAEKGKTEFLLLGQRLKLETLVFYFFLLLLPTQFGKHFWPPFSQIMGVRIDYLSPTIYATDLLILALFLIISLSKTVDWSVLITRNLGWIIFIIYLCTNIFLSHNPLLGLYGLVKFLELFFIGSYIARNTRIKKDLSVTVFIFTITIVFESLLAISQYIHQGSLNGLFYFLGERKFASFTLGIANASINGGLVLRPYGTFSHPNVLAGFLLCGLILIAAFFKEKEGLALKIIKTTALLLGSIGLFLTLSRIAIVIWIFLAILLLIQKLIKQFKNKFKSRMSYMALFIVVISLGLAFFTPVISRLQNSYLTEKAVTQRIELFKSTLTIIHTHPLFGVGLYNFLPNLASLQKPLFTSSFLQPVHNIYLLITAELGIAGVVFIFIFLYKTYKRLTKHTDLARKTILTILTTILILGMFDHYWLTLQQGQLLLATILGLAWSDNLLEKKSRI